MPVDLLEGARDLLADEAINQDERRLYWQQGEAPSMLDNVFDLFADPEKERAKAVQALVDAEAFDIRPSDAYRYRDAIDLGVKLNKNAVAASRRTSLMDRVQQSWETGVNQVAVGLHGADVVMSNDPAALEKMLEAQKRMPTEDTEYIPESKLEYAFRSAAKMSPMMFQVMKESIKKGLPVGLAAGGAAALLGQAGPQALLPEEIITVPAATAIGGKAAATGAAFTEALKLESGMAFSEFMNLEDDQGNKIDLNIARAAAFGVGAINAGLEVAQIKTLLKTIPGLGRAIGKAIMGAVTSKALKDRLAGAAKVYAGTVAKETAQELAQESTNIVMEHVAAHVNNAIKGTDIDPSSVEEILDRLLATGKESAAAFSVMALPGASLRVLPGGREKARKTATGSPQPADQAGAKGTAAMPENAPTGGPLILGVNESQDGEVTSFTMADPATGQTFDVPALKTEDRDRVRVVPDMEAVNAAMSEIGQADQTDAIFDRIIEGREDIDQAAGALFGETEQLVEDGAPQPSNVKNIDGVNVIEPTSGNKIGRGVEVASLLEPLDTADLYDPSVFDVDSAKQAARAYYDDLANNPVVSPAFNGDVVRFDDSGWEHILGTRANERKLSDNNVKRRLKLLPKVKATLENTPFVDEIRERGDIKEYGLLGVFDDKSVVRVVVQEESKNGKSFLSVYDWEDVSKKLKRPTLPESSLSNTVSHGVGRAPSNRVESNLAPTADEVKPKLNVVDAVKNINDRLGEKGSIDLEPVIDLGRSLWAEGHQTIEAFTARAKELLADVWDKVKDLVAKAWSVLNNERGSFSTKPIKTQIKEATGQAKPKDRLVTEYAALTEAFRKEALTARAAYNTGKHEEVERSKEVMRWLIKRRESLKTVRDYFGLTDAEMMSATKRRNPALMDDAEFKQFLRDVELKAVELAETRQEKMALLKLIEEKRLQKVDNYRQAIQLPTFSEMNAQQLRDFAKLLEPFQDDDVFLTQRELETVDRTDLKGIRTWREARERLAKQVGVDVEELNKVHVGTLDTYRFDSSLRERDPFFNVLVTDMTTAMLGAQLRAHEVETQVYALAKKSEASRDRGIIGRLIPQDDLIVAFLEAPMDRKGAIAEQMTPEQIDYAHFIQQYFAEALNYLLATKSLERGRENYFVHIRRSFLENLKDGGLKSAISNLFKNYQQDQMVFNILDDDTGNILPLEKFFQFSLQRTDVMDPTRNVTKAFLTYMHTFEKKKMFDAIIPKLDIYAQALTPTRYTPRGLEIDRSLKTFVNKWINNKKGRRISFDSTLRQGGPLDVGIRALRSFTTIIDLGLAPVAQTAAFLGEQVANAAMLGNKAMAVGTARTRTEKGKRILKKYEAWVGRSLWEEFTAPGKEVTERLSEMLFAGFHLSSVTANKQFLLASITEQEWQSETISTERLSEMRLDLGRFRVVPGTGSLVGSTTAGDAVMQYKKWAVPIARTLNVDAQTLVSDLRKKPLGEALTSREAKELFRFAYLSMAVFAVGAMAGAEDDDRSYLGKAKARMYREAMTLMQGIDPTLWLSTPRTLTWLYQTMVALKSLVFLETYKTGDKAGELKGDDWLMRQFTPATVRQAMSDEKSKSR